MKHCESLVAATNCNTVPVCFQQLTERLYYSGPRTNLKSLFHWFNTYLINSTFLVPTNTWDTLISCPSNYLKNCTSPFAETTWNTVYFFFQHLPKILYNCCPRKFFKLYATMDPVITYNLYILFSASTWESLNLRSRQLLHAMFISVPRNHMRKNTFFVLATISNSVRLWSQQLH